MKRFALFVGFAALTLVSCGGKDEGHSEDDVDAISQNQGPRFTFASYAPGDSVHYYGRKITAEGAIPASELAENPNADNFEGKVTGTVVSVCQNKGCWMKLETGDGKSMRVTFKDYGFFVPKDLAGKTVVVEGSADRKTVSVDEQKHYAGDAGKSQEEIDAITEPKVELSFVASGVIVIE